MAQDERGPVSHMREHEGQREWMPLLLAFCCALLAAGPLLLHPGFVVTRAGGDSPFLLQRVHAILRNLEAGVIPAHWMPDAAFGLGYPAFNYYAALPYYFAAAMARAGAGIVWGTRLAQVSSLILAAWGTYGLARACGLGPWASLVASAAYSFAPFHLVNIYVRGDALSELFAQGLLPVTLWAILRVVRSPSRGRVAGAAVAYASLIVSHNITALLATPVLATVLLAGALARPRQVRVRALGAGVLSVLVGLALAFWFWGPALWEAPLVQLDEQTTGYLHYAGHFLDGALVQGSILHDYAMGDGQRPFSMGLVQAILLGLSVLWLGLHSLRSRRFPWGAGVAAMVGVSCTWLMTSSSAWVWEHVPLLRYAQFPWRLLGVQALAGALLIGEALRGCRVRGRPWAVGIVCVTLACAGLLTVRPDRIALRDGDIGPEKLMFYETYSGNIGGTIRHEYLPRGMNPRPNTSAVQMFGDDAPAPLVLEGVMMSSELVWHVPESQRWRLDIGRAARVAFHTTYLPGWTARVNGQVRDVVPIEGLGLVGLELRPGLHEVELYYAGSPLRRAAEWVSLLAVCGLLVWCLWGVGRDPARRRRLLLRAAGAGLSVLWVWWAPLSANDAPTPGPVIADYDRCPLLHAEPGGVLWGRARLLDYTLGTDAVEAGRTLVLRLFWEQPIEGYRVEVELTGASWHLNRPAPIWARNAAAIDGSETVLRMALPEYMAPGVYVLRVRVDDGDDLLAPTNRDGREMRYLVLRPVRVMRSETGLDVDSVPVASFGPENAPPEIALLQVDTETRGREVDVALLFRAERQMARNYWLSVRFQRTDGELLEGRDLPPFLGGCPTSLWAPGMPLEERVILRLPEESGVPARGIVEVVVYDRATMASRGSYRAPFIASPEP